MNTARRTTCEQCGARLPRLEDAPPPEQPHVERPGFVTLWVLLLGMYLAVYAVVLALNAATSAPLAARDLLALGGAAVGLVVTAAILGGIWRMKPWARLPAIGLHAVLAILFGVSELTGEAADGVEGFFERAGSLIWLGALAAVIVWLATHRAAFYRVPHVPPPHDPGEG